MNNTTRRATMDEALRHARAITKRADEEHRTMTDDERAEVTALLGVASNLKSDIQVNKLVAGSGSGETPLLERFKSAGWRPGARTYIPDTGTKTASFDGDTDDLNPTRREGAPLGFDQRFIHMAFPVVPVDQLTTSVQVLSQKSRQLADPVASSGVEGVVRDIDATDPKAETDSVKELTTVTLQGVATVQSGTPNIVLNQPGFQTMVQQDLRLAILGGYDAIVTAAIVACTPQTTMAGDDLFDSIRNAIEDLASEGYTASTLIVSPADAVAMDLFKSSGPEEIYQAGVGSFMRNPFGLTVRVGKDVTDPMVVAASSFGSMYLTGLTLATFEDADSEGHVGAVNTSTVRLEGNCAFGVERERALSVIVASS